MTPLNIVSCATFAAGLGAILYVLAGYPLLLQRVARRQSRTIQKDDTLRTVSIVIAVRNGEKFIGKKLQSLLSANYPRELMQVTVVSTTAPIKSCAASNPMAWRSFALSAAASRQR